MRRGCVYLPLQSSKFSIIFTCSELSHPNFQREFPFSGHPVSSGWPLHQQVRQELRISEFISHNRLCFVGDMSDPDEEGPDEVDTTVTAGAEEEQAFDEGAGGSPEMEGPSVAFLNGLKEGRQGPSSSPERGREGAAQGLSRFFEGQGRRELPDPDGIAEVMSASSETPRDSSGSLGTVETASDQSFDSEQVPRSSSHRSVKPPRLLMETASSIPDRLTDVSSISSVPRLPTPDISTTGDTTPDISTPLDAAPASLHEEARRDGTLPIAVVDQHSLPEGFPRVYPRLEEATLIGNASFQRGEESDGADGPRIRNNAHKRSKSAVKALDLISEVSGPELLVESTPIVARRSTSGLSTLYERTGEGRQNTGGVAWARCGEEQDVRDAEKRDTENIKLWMRKNPDQQSSMPSERSGGESLYAKLKRLAKRSGSVPPPPATTRPLKSAPGLDYPTLLQSTPLVDEDDGFLFLREPPANRTPLPQPRRRNNRPSALSPELQSQHDIINALLKRCPDSSTLRRRTNIPLPTGPPPPKNVGDSREVN